MAPLSVGKITEIATKHKNIADERICNGIKLFHIVLLDDQKMK